MKLTLHEEAYPKRTLEEMQPFLPHYIEYTYELENEEDELQSFFQYIQAFGAQQTGNRQFCLSSSFCMTYFKEQFHRFQEVVSELSLTQFSTDCFEWDELQKLLTNEWDIHVWVHDEVIPLDTFLRLYGEQTTPFFIQRLFGYKR